jgi:aminopeptidase N
LLLAIPVAVADTGPPPLPDPDERDQLLGITKQGRLTAPEKVGLIAQEEFDATHYLIDIEFDDQAESIGGVVVMTATSLVEGLQTVQLDLRGNMTVSAVSVDGSPTGFTHAGDVLEIDLGTPVGISESFAVSITYGGSPAGGPFGWNKYASSGQGQMVWSLSEPNGARYWWPCKDRPDDKALVEERWTVRSDWIATGNGVLVSEQPVSGNRKQYIWVPTHPLTTYLVSVAATGFVHFADTYTSLQGGSMPVDYYVYPEDLADAQISLSETVPMLEFYAQRFGEYPFLEDKYGISAFPFGGAMEHSTNTSYGYILLNGAHTYDYINAHEAAHQWWGDSVSPETWSDIWLNEGFASYSEALWFEHLGGSSSLQAYMTTLFRESFSGPVYDPFALFSSTVYNKGAWVLHMLRGVMGGPVFFQSLKTWYTANKDGVGNTAQFQAHQEMFYDGSLDWFFDQWVYGVNRPTYRAGFITADAGGGLFRNYVRVRQIQTDAGTFTMPVQLTLQTASGSEVRSVWNDLPDQTFVLETTEPLTGLVLDAAGWILKDSVGPLSLVDLDSDGVPDTHDNCTATPNSPQLDFDSDGFGDACDSDDDDDLLVDALDCAPTDPEQGVPGEVVSLTLQHVVGGATTLSWTAADRADSYEISRGLLSEVDASYGSCLESGLLGLTRDDPDLPPVNDGYLYLVGARDSGCGGGGSTGTDSADTPRTSPCP